MLYKIASYLILLSYMTAGNACILAGGQVLDTGIAMFFLSILICLVCDTILFMNFKVYGE